MQRRIVTVLFVDMVGFTALATGLDPEDVGELQSGYFAAVSEVIHRYDGIVEKYIGDAVMAVFGVPRCDGHDAYRAVLAGLQLPDAVAGLRLPDGRPARVRVGIATGEALVDGYPTDGGQRLVCGDIVNTAARLQGQAAVGTVLVDTATHRATHAVLRYQGLGPIRVAGKPESLEVWRPLAQHAEPAPTDEVPLVGRDAELTTLVRHVAAALDARSSGLVSLVGPTGCGRSRLIRELAQQPGIGIGDGVRWRVARCRPGGACDPAVEEVLREATRGGPDQRAAVVVEDVHWAAQAVLRRIRELASGYPRVAVVVTAATDLFTTSVGPGVRVELPDLGPEESALLLDRLLGRAGLSAGLVGRLLPLVHGNPGYAEAYVGALAESGTPPGPGDRVPVPEAVGAAVSARVDRLAGPERVALLVACAVGPVVSGQVMAHLLQTTYDDACRALRRLVDAGMLAMCPEPVDVEPRYAFPDPAVRTVGYARLSRYACADLQHRAAQIADSVAGQR